MDHGASPRGGWGHEFVMNREAEVSSNGEARPGEARSSRGSFGTPY